MFKFTNFDSAEMCINIINMCVFWGIFLGWVYHVTTLCAQTLNMRAYLAA